MVRFPLKVHDGSNEPHIDTVEEIPVASLSPLIGIPNAAKVNLPYPPLLYPINNLGILSFLYIPKVSKVIHQTVGYHCQGNLLPDITVCLHQAVDSVVECRVASDDDYCTVTVVNHHLHQSLNTSDILTLYIVVYHTLLLETFLYLRPALG